MSLQGKKIIITGATSGFGVQMAAVLLAEGASVFIGGRRADKGEQVAKETQSTFHKVDVAEDTSNQEFFAAAEKHFGGKNTVDYILLYAGVEGESQDTMLATLDIKSYDYIYKVNVRGVMLGLQYGTPLLRSQGTFLVTSSAGSVLPFSGNPVYASSKAAVDSLVRSYAAQLAESDDERLKSLSIVSMNPTLYATELSERFLGTDDAAVGAGFATKVNPSQRMGTASELAGLVRDFVQQKLPYQSGDNFVVDADTHFPLNEYFDRMAAATAAAASS